MIYYPYTVSTVFFTHFEEPCSSRALGDITGLRVLDLACGSGRFTRWLKTSKNAGEVVGLEMSEHMIQQVNPNYEIIYN